MASQFGEDLSKAQALWRPVDGEWVSDQAGDKKEEVTG